MWNRFLRREVVLLLFNNNIPRPWWRRLTNSFRYFLLSFRMFCVMLSQAFFRFINKDFQPEVLGHNILYVLIKYGKFNRLSIILNYMEFNLNFVGHPNLLLHKTDLKIFNFLNDR